VCGVQVAKLTAQLEKDEASGAGTTSKAAAPLEKKRKDHTALCEEVTLRTTALESAAADLEAFAADLASDGGERSIATLVAQVRDRSN
jgi:hypothetical protein